MEKSTSPVTLELFFPLGVNLKPARALVSESGSESLFDYRESRSQWRKYMEQAEQTMRDRAKSEGDYP